MSAGEAGGGDISRRSRNRRSIWWLPLSWNPLHKPPLFNQHTSASPPPNKGETNPARCQEMSEQEQQEQEVNWETNALSRWCDHSAPAAHLKICLSGEIWQKFPNFSSSSFSIQQEFLGGIPYLSNLLGPKNVDPNYSAYVSSKLDELCKWPRGREGGNTRTSPSWDTVSVESRDEQQLCLKTNSGKLLQINH